MRHVSERLHFEVHEGNGPPALLLHGILSSRAQWLPNLEALRDVCRPVVIELWGHGRSPTPADPRAYHPVEGYADQLEAIRRSVADESCVVIGQSLGGAIAMNYAFTYPTSVRALVITNSQSAFGDATWRSKLLDGLRKSASDTRTGGIDAVRSHRRHPRGARHIDEAIKAQLVADADLVNPEAVAWAYEKTIPDSSSHGRLSQLEVPLLVTNGMREEAFATGVAYVRETLPDAEIVDLNAGHAVNLQAVDAWNAAVVDFLRRRLSPPR